MQTFQTAHCAGKLESPRYLFTFAAPNHQATTKNDFNSLDAAPPSSPPDGFSG